MEMNALDLVLVLTVTCSVWSRPYSMMLSGFKYLGTSMNINIERNRVVIEVIDTEDGGAELLLQLNQTYSGSKKLTIGRSPYNAKPPKAHYI